MIEIDVSTLKFSSRKMSNIRNKIVAINLWMLYGVNPRARGDIKFPLSKEPCFVVFLFLFLRLPVQRK